MARKRKMARSERSAENRAPEALLRRAYAAPLPPPLPTPDPWADEDEAAALSRRYGHLDFDRGLYVLTNPRDECPDARAVLASAGVVAFGALALWLWPAAAGAP